MIRAIDRAVAWCSVRRITVVALCVIVLDWVILGAMISGGGSGVVLFSLVALNPLTHAGRTHGSRPAMYSRVNGVWIDDRAAAPGVVIGVPEADRAWIVRRQSVGFGAGLVLPWVVGGPEISSVRVFRPGGGELSAADQAAVLKLFATDRLGDAELVRYLPEGGKWRARVVWQSVFHDGLVLPLYVVAVWAFFRRRTFVRLRDVVKARTRRLCVQCGYDRSGTPGRACPECGFGNNSEVG